MSNFQNPPALLLILFIPLLYFFRKIGFLKQISFILTISDWNGNSFSYKPLYYNLFSTSSKLTCIIAFTAAIIAAADPVIFKKKKTYTMQGADIIFVLDVSPSMAAQDMNGISRLECAKKAILSLIDTNTGNFYGLAAFADETLITVPATCSYDFFKEKLNSLQIGCLGTGTAIGTGLAAAIYHLISSSAQRKCIVLVTDGENNAGAVNTETAVGLAVKNNIKVYTLGIGTQGTVSLEYIDPVTGKNYSGYLDSSFDKNSLKQIASYGGGSYFEVQSLEDLAFALSVIEKNEETFQAYHTTDEAVHLYSSFIFISMILFLISWIIQRIILKEFV